MGNLNVQTDTEHIFSFCFDSKRRSRRIDSLCRWVLNIVETFQLSMFLVASEAHQVFRDSLTSWRLIVNWNFLLASPVLFLSFDIKQLRAKSILLELIIILLETFLIIVSLYARDGNRKCVRSDGNDCLSTRSQPAKWRTTGDARGKVPLNRFIPETWTKFWAFLGNFVAKFVSQTCQPRSLATSHSCLTHFLFPPTQIRVLKFFWTASLIILSGERKMETEIEVFKELPKPALRIMWLCELSSVAGASFRFFLGRGQILQLPPPFPPMRS